MSTSALQLDPDVLKRNLAITLGTQAPQLGNLRQPEMAAPGPIALPGQGPPDLAIARPPSVQAPRGTIPAEEAERSRMMSTGSGESQISSRIKGSQFGQNHPKIAGVLGPLAQGAATLGDIGLSAVAPSLAINTPGTEYHHDMLLNRENKQIGGLEKEQGEEAASTGAKARAGLENEEAAELPGKTASEEALQSAQTNKINNPEEEWKSLPGVIGPKGEPVEIESKSGQIRFGDVSGLQQQKQPKPDTPEQQYIDEYQRMHQGSTVADAERAYTADTQKAPQAIMLVPGANGGYTAQNVRPGSQVAGDAVTPGGVNTLNTPTAQTRNMAEMAQTVLPQMTQVSKEVDQLAASIGPAVGRWNQLLTNKGGTDFPQFAKLDTDLDLLASAIVRTHFGARGGQGYREELRKQFGEAQSPEDLKARISAANGWLEGYAHMADRGAPAAGAGAGEPAVGTVEDGYRYKGGGAANQANWEKVTTQ